MNHQIDIEMTATISETVAMEMIVSAVEQQTGKRVTDIQVKNNGNTFEGFHVTFDPKEKLKVVPFKPSKEFIVNHFDEN